MSTPSPDRKSNRFSVQYDYIIKLLLIGDSAVGKSSLICRFTGDTFSPQFTTTIGIDFKIKTLELDGKSVKLMIWDTAGQERFRSISTAFYRDAMGILLVYDVSDERTLNNIKNWVRDVELNAPQLLDKVLIGNKCDLETKAVSTERGQALADEYGIKFFETSAKDASNVKEAFLSLTKDIKERIDKAGPIPESRSPGSPLGSPLSSPPGSPGNSGDKAKKGKGTCCG